MSQDLSKTINTKNAVKRHTGAVLPKEDVTVYATDVIGGIIEAGTKMTVHAALAKKLISSGKATEKEPTLKQKKEETK